MRECKGVVVREIERESVDGSVRERERECKGVVPLQSKRLCCA